MKQCNAWVVDHFDSFTYNVVHGLAEAGARVTVRRVDCCSLAEIEAARPDLLVLSPGPGTPAEAQLGQSAVIAFAGKIPIFGICLGMQVLATAWGGRVDRAREPVHGKAFDVFHDGMGLFEGLPSPFPAGRYHSLCVTHVPEELQVAAWCEDGVVMALRHRTMPLAGVQFHPDSFLTPAGKVLFEHAIRGHF